MAVDVMAFLRGSVDRVLGSEPVRAAFDRVAGRYAELLSLRCAESGGLEAVVRVKGFTEDVRVVLRRAQIAEDGSWVKPLELGADKEGLDALLKDMVQGREFPLPKKVHSYATMLKKLFPA